MDISRYIHKSNFPLLVLPKTKLALNDLLKGCTPEKKQSCRWDKCLNECMKL